MDNNLLWNDEQYKAWVFSRPFDELKAGFWEREQRLHDVRALDTDPVHRYRAVNDAHDSAIPYIVALEAALKKAQAPYKFDTILVTPEIVALFRERENTEQWIAEWTTRRFAQLYEHISNRQSWWVTCFQWGATELPDDLVNAARLAYVEYMTTP